MKSIINKLILISVLLSLNLLSLLSQKDTTFKNSNLLDFDDVFGDIRVTYPSKSETLLIGGTYTIEWEYKGGIDQVSIGLYKNSEFIEYIIFVTVNDGHYIWKVGNYTKDNDYSIGVWDYNDFNSGDFSDSFVITSGLNSAGQLMIVVGILLCLGLISLVFLILILLKEKNIIS